MALDELESTIQISTVETIARSFYGEALAYGFGTQDFLRFVNLVLEKALSETPGDEGSPERGPDLEPVDGDLRLPLFGERVVIRAYDSTRDAELMLRWLADRDGRHFLLSRSTGRTLDARGLLESSDTVLGMIGVHGVPKPVGAIAFLDHDADQHRAELRKLIGDPGMRGRGLAKEATRLWIRYGLGALHLHKIYLNTLGTNLRNIRLNEELGFKVEGMLRSEVLIDGRHCDMVRMGLLAGSLEEAASELAAVGTNTSSRHEQVTGSVERVTHT